MLLKEKAKQKLKIIYSSLIIPTRIQCLVTICLAFLLCSCSSTKKTTRRSTSGTSIRSDIVSLASKQKGDQYVYGAKGPSKFDCSGLVSYVFNNNGFDVNGSTAMIYKSGKSIKFSEARPGDLVFYKKRGKIFHVSIITKRQNKELWVIHSTSSKGVIEENVLASRYWEPMIYRIVSLDSLRD